MTTTKEYEIFASDGDDEKDWCASVDELDEAVHYARQYLEDYAVVTIVETTRKQIMELQK